MYSCLGIPICISGLQKYTYILFLFFLDDFSGFFLFMQRLVFQKFNRLMKRKSEIS